MNDKVLIAPSILAASFGELEKEIKRAESSGGDLLHIDVMDGVFVPPITFGENMVRLSKNTSSLYREVHLMVQEPHKIIENFIEAGSQRIIIHVESSSDIINSLELIRSKNVSAGLCIKPTTPVTSLIPYLDYCDLILIMTVEPGFGGQPFLNSCLAKIRETKNMILQYSKKILIEVDGGINNHTAKDCISAGADILVAGTYLFNDKDMKDKIKALKDLK